MLTSGKVLPFIWPPRVRHHPKLKASALFDCTTKRHSPTRNPKLRARSAINRNACKKKARRHQMNHDSSPWFYQTFGPDYLTTHRRKTTQVRQNETKPNSQRGTRAQSPARHLPKLNIWQSNSAIFTSKFTASAASARSPAGPQRRQQRFTWSKPRKPTGISQS